MLEIRLCMSCILKLGGNFSFELLNLLTPMELRAGLN